MAHHSSNSPHEDVVPWLERQTLKALGWCLPRAVRRRQIHEWQDHLDCTRATSGGVGHELMQVVRSAPSIAWTALPSALRVSLPALMTAIMAALALWPAAVEHAPQQARAEFLTPMSGTLSGSMNGKRLWLVQAKDGEHGVHPTDQRCEVGPGTWTCGRAYVGTGDPWEKGAPFTVQLLAVDIGGAADDTFQKYNGNVANYQPIAMPPGVEVMASVGVLARWPTSSVALARARPRPPLRQSAQMILRGRNRLGFLEVERPSAWARRALGGRGSRPKG